MLLAILIDDKELIEKINSLKNNNNPNDFNKIIIDLLKQGFKFNDINEIKQSIQDNILLKVNDQVRNIINEELKNINNNDNITTIIEKTTDTLDQILNKLNNVEIVTNANISKNSNNDSINIDNIEKESDYDKYIKENKKELNVDVDINPLLLNILSNANR